MRGLGGRTRGDGFAFPRSRGSSEDRYKDIDRDYVKSQFRGQEEAIRRLNELVSLNKKK